MKGTYKTEAVSLTARPCSALSSLLILTPRTRMRLNLKAKGLLSGLISDRKEASPAVPRLRLKQPSTRFSLFSHRRETISVSRGTCRRDIQTAHPSLTGQSAFKGLGESQRPASVAGIRNYSNKSSPVRVLVPRMRVCVNQFNHSDAPAPWTPIND